MKYRSLAAIVGLSFFVTGCASLIGASSAEWPWADKDALCKNDSCTSQEAVNAFVKASNFCRSVQNYYERGGQRANSNHFIIGAVGTLAGSVAAPIAKGTAATAWSGLSGATNALQISMEEAFSANVAVKRRAAVALAAENGAKDYANETAPEKKIVLAVDMARACAMSSAKADQQALQALSAEQE